jgi:uncharacterized membrane protein
MNLPRRSTAFPVDVIAVVLAVVAAFVALQLPGGTPLRVVMTLPLLLFLPGYAITTAAFPASETNASAHTLRRGPASGRTDDASRETDLPRESKPDVGSIDGLERLASSFALSIASVALTMIGLVALSVGIGRRQVITALAALVIVANVVGVVRRSRVHPQYRYRPLRGITKFAADVTRNGTPANVALVLSVVVVLAMFAGAIIAPQNGSRYTNFALLTQTESGEYVTAGYPTDVNVGETVELTLSVTNYEQQRTNYVVVALLQQDENGRTIRSREVDRLETTVAPTNTSRVTHDFSPAMTGEYLRLRYLLYKGHAPDIPTSDNAYRSLYIKFNVTDDPGAQGSLQQPTHTVGTAH